MMNLTMKMIDRYAFRVKLALPGLGKKFRFESRSCHFLSLS
jgi:hypothetical protein